MKRAPPSTGGRWYISSRAIVNLAAGYVEVTAKRESEAAARRIFANQVRVAEALAYASVQLRYGGSVVERWPVVAGDDPDIGDLRRAASLISHRATAHGEGLHWSLSEASGAGRLAPLLRAVDAAPRMVIDYFSADAAAIDEQIRRFAVEGSADSFGAYNCYAARAITALHAEDRAALNAVFDAVNSEAAGARLVGAVCDVYAGLLPVLSTTAGQQFLSQSTARITAIDDQMK